MWWHDEFRLLGIRTQTEQSNFHSYQTPYKLPMKSINDKYFIHQNKSKNKNNPRIIAFVRIVGSPIKKDRQKHCETLAGCIAEITSAPKLWP
jgi:hypothetical protein